MVRIRGRITKIIGGISEEEFVARICGIGAGSHGSDGMRWRYRGTSIGPPAERDCDSNADPPAKQHSTEELVEFAKQIKAADGSTRAAVSGQELVAQYDPLRR